MITIKDEPDCKPFECVDEFEPGGTFKWKARYYLVVEVIDSDGGCMKTAVDLNTGEEIGKSKTPPLLYPIDFVMYVDHG